MLRFWYLSTISAGFFVVIGSGKTSHLGELLEVTEYGGELLTDPSMRSYKILVFTSAEADDPPPISDLLGPFSSPKIG